MRLSRSLVLFSLFSFTLLSACSAARRGGGGNVGEQDDIDRADRSRLDAAVPRADASVPDVRAATADVTPTATDARSATDVRAPNDGGSLFVADVRISPPSDTGSAAPVDSSTPDRCLGVSCRCGQTCSAGTCIGATCSNCLPDGTCGPDVIEDPCDDVICRCGQSCFGGFCSGAPCSGCRTDGSCPVAGACSPAESGDRITAVSGSGTLIVERFPSFTQLNTRVTDSAGGERSGVCVEWSASGPLSVGPCASSSSGSDGIAGCAPVGSDITSMESYIRVPVTARLSNGASASFHIIAVYSGPRSGFPMQPYPHYITPESRDVGLVSSGDTREVVVAIETAVGLTPGRIPGVSVVTGGAGQCVESGPFFTDGNGEFRCNVRFFSSGPFTMEFGGSVNASVLSSFE